MLILQRTNNATKNKSKGVWSSSYNRSLRHKSRYRDTHERYSQSRNDLSFMTRDMTSRTLGSSARADLFSLLLAFSSFRRSNPVKPRTKHPTLCPKVFPPSIPHKLITTVSTAPETVQHIKTVPIARYIPCQYKASRASPMAKLRPPNTIMKGIGENEEVLAEGYGSRPKRRIAGRGDRRM